MAGANHYQHSGSKGLTQIFENPPVVKGLTQIFEDNSLALNETCSDTKFYWYYGY